MATEKENDDQQAKAPVKYSSSWNNGFFAKYNTLKYMDAVWMDKTKSHSIPSLIKLLVSKYLLRNGFHRHMRAMVTSMSLLCYAIPQF